MNDEQCPRCTAVFPAERAWAHRSVKALLIAPALQDLDTRVRCPSCQHVFQAQEFRFFGFVSPRIMKAAVGLFFVLGLAAAFYLLVIDAP